MLNEEPWRGLTNKTRGLQVGLEHGEFAFNVLSGWQSCTDYAIVRGSWETPDGGEPGVDMQSNPQQKVARVAIPLVVDRISWQTPEVTELSRPPRNPPQPA